MSRARKTFRVTACTCGVEAGVQACCCVEDEWAALVWQVFFAAVYSSVLLAQASGHVVLFL